MARFFICLVRLYQKYISPAMPPSCRHYPTCSSYAIEAFEVHGAAVGLFLTVKRILKCNPFFKSGFDPVPTKNGENEKIKD